MVHQDTTRTDIVDSLLGDFVLITQDCAMTFLPAQYRKRELSPGTFDSLSEKKERRAGVANVRAHDLV